ncbi:hypothetical protein DFJ73DRAFT_839964 [Zopfochytrium polystomum]|nr:hypothetical protein DFJ73DRAFT_839964 [Zopfochytrium polystomum]
MHQQQQQHRHPPPRLTHQPPPLQVPHGLEQKQLLLRKQQQNQQQNQQQLQQQEQQQPNRQKLNDPGSSSRYDAALLKVVRKTGHRTPATAPNTNARPINHPQVRQFAADLAAPRPSALRIAANALRIHQSGMEVSRLGNGRLRVGSSQPTLTSVAPQREAESEGSATSDSHHDDDSQNCKFSGGKGFLPSDKTACTERNLFAAQPPQQYTFVPPAAAKYFLWDDTPTGESIHLDTSKMFTPSIRIQCAATRSLFSSFDKLKQLNSHDVSLSGSAPVPCLGYLIGRLSAPSSVTNPLAESIYSLDLLADRMLVLNRFDPGHRALTDDGKHLITPTAEIEGEVLVKVISLESKGTFVESVLCQMMDAYSDSLKASNPYPLILGAHSDGTDYFISSLQLAPKIVLDIQPIHALRMAPTQLSLQLLNGDSTQVTQEGYVAMDQARHVFPLLPCDPMKFQLPLLGVWIKLNGLINRKTQIMVAEFLLDSRKKKLDTGKNIMLLVLFSPSEAGDPLFYQCRYEISAEIYDVYKSTSRVFVDDCGPENNISSICDPHLVDPVECSEFVSALKVVHAINLDGHFDKAKCSSFEQSPSNVTSPLKTPSLLPSPVPEESCSDQRKDSTSDQHDSTISTAEPPPSSECPGPNNVVNADQNLQTSEQILNALKHQMEKLQTTSTAPLSAMPTFLFNPYHQFQMAQTFPFLYAMPGLTPFAVGPGPSVGPTEPNSRKLTASVGTNTSFVHEWKQEQSGLQLNSIKKSVATSPDRPPSSVAQREKSQPTSQHGISTGPIGTDVSLMSSRIELQQELFNAINVPIQDLPPPDTGSNYKPLYTFDAVPTYFPGSTSLVPEWIPVPEEMHSSPASSYPGSEAFRAFDPHKTRNNHPKTKLSPLQSAGVSSRKSNSDDDDNLERTQELIARLVSNPEESFIFVDDKDASPLESGFAQLDSPCASLFPNSLPDCTNRSQDGSGDCVQPELSYFTTSIERTAEPGTNSKTLSAASGQTPSCLEVTQPLRQEVPGLSKARPDGNADNSQISVTEQLSAGTIDYLKRHGLIS